MNSLFNAERHTRHVKDRDPSRAGLGRAQQHIELSLPLSARLNPDPDLPAIQTYADTPTVETQDPLKALTIPPRSDVTNIVDEAAVTPRQIKPPEPLLGVLSDGKRQRKAGAVLTTIDAHSQALIELDVG